MARFSQINNQQKDWQASDKNLGSPITTNLSGK